MNLGHRRWRPKVYVPSFNMNILKIDIEKFPEYSVDDWIRYAQSTSRLNGETRIRLNWMKNGRLIGSFCPKISSMDDTIRTLGHIVRIGVVGVCDQFPDGAIVYETYGF